MSLILHTLMTQVYVTYVILKMWALNFGMHGITVHPRRMYSLTIRSRWTILFQTSYYILCFSLFLHGTVFSIFSYVLLKGLYMYNTQTYIFLLFQICLIQELSFVTLLRMKNTSQLSAFFRQEKQALRFHETLEITIF